jgi:hypothetical protein
VGQAAEKIHKKMLESRLKCRKLEKELQAHDESVDVTPLPTLLLMMVCQMNCQPPAWRHISQLQKKLCLIVRTEVIGTLKIFSFNLYCFTDCFHLIETATI